MLPAKSVKIKKKDVIVYLSSLYFMFCFVSFKNHVLANSVYWEYVMTFMVKWLAHWISLSRHL